MAGREARLRLGRIASEAEKAGGAAPRRKALTQRFALLAAGRLAAMEDPAGVADLRAALRVE